MRIGLFLFLVSVFSLSGVSFSEEKMVKESLPVSRAPMSQRFGFVSQIGGNIGGVGIGLSYRPFSFLELEGKIGSAFISKNFSITSRFYLEDGVWSPYIDAGYTRFDFDGPVKVNRFLMYYFDVFPSEEKPSIGFLHLLFGFKRTIHPKLAWTYDAGFFIQKNDVVLLMPILGLSLRWYVL